MPHALEAVLAEVEREGFDVVLFGGDLIVGPFPERVVARARELDGARFVRGNAEREPGEWDRERLRGDDLRWLADWPFSASIDGVLYCHATPQDDTTITTVFTPDDALRASFGGGRGARRRDRAHAPPVRAERRRRARRQRRLGRHAVRGRGGGVLGASVDDGEPSFRKTAFDVERAVADIRASGWPRGRGVRDREPARRRCSRDEAATYFEGSERERPRRRRPRRPAARARRLVLRRGRERGRRAGSRSARSCSSATASSRSSARGGRAAGR